MKLFVAIRQMDKDVPLPHYVYVVMQHVDHHLMFSGISAHACQRVQFFLLRGIVSRKLIRRNTQLTRDWGKFFVFSLRSVKRNRNCLLSC